MHPFVLAQITDAGLKTLTDAGAVVILALAIGYMAYVLQRNNTGASATMNTMLQYNGRLATAIEKLEQHEGEQTVVLKDVVSSNEKVVSTNEAVMKEIELTRKSSDDHQIAVAETLDGLRQDTEKSRSSIVARQDLMTAAIEDLAKEIRLLQPDKTQLEKLQAIEHLIQAMDQSIKEVITKCGERATAISAPQPERTATT
jgi:hypothetical protein